MLLNCQITLNSWSSTQHFIVLEKENRIKYPHTYTHTHNEYTRDTPRKSERESGSDRETRSNAIKNMKVHSSSFQNLHLNLLHLPVTCSYVKPTLFQQFYKGSHIHLALSSVVSSLVSYFLLLLLYFEHVRLIPTIIFMQGKLPSFQLLR